MTQDAQVRKLFSLLAAGHSLRVSSLKTGMTVKTARKYRKAERMPSELSARHDWRTRVDPFSAVWESVEKQLAEAREELLESRCSEDFLKSEWDDQRKTQKVKRNRKTF